MKWLNAYRMKLVLVGFIATFVLSAGSAYADFTFSAPVRLGPPIWPAQGDPQSCCFSKDGLELYFSQNRSGGYGQNDIWVARRETVDAPWGEPVNLGPNVNGPQSEVDPAISPDGLELYFNWMTDERLRVCSRASKDAPWSKLVFMGAPFAGYDCIMTEFSADGLSLYSVSNRPGRYGHADIWVSARATSSAPWSNPVNLGPNINDPMWEFYPSLSSDGRVLFFSSNQQTDGTTLELFFSTRATAADAWGPAINCDVINQLGGEVYDPELSPDGSVLYFTRGSSAYQSSLVPIVDFNSDGIVDAADVCIMVHHWGENYSLCDIGLMPWGDGIVNVEDMKVIAKHLDDRLIAHWKLDETEDDIAYDSARTNDATLSGQPLWQPDVGMVGGALQLDGIDDYVRTNHVLNPADGAFSVLAWVKGGAPGQVILSQANGMNWLCLDSVEGYLMMELKATGRSAGPLMSQSVITDGNWHRIGLVRDGSYRHLYVDGMEVAKDVTPLSDLASAEGGLYFGVGSTLAPGTFFSGLIDDVRIYDVALSAEEIAALAQ